MKKISKMFGKFLKIFLRNLLKMHYFSIVFSQFNEAMGQFLQVWTKNAIATFSLENCEKCINLADFSQNLRNYALIFCAFGRKRQF